MKDKLRNYNIALLLITNPAKRPIKDPATAGIMHNRLTFLIQEAQPEIQSYISPTVEGALEKAVAAGHDHCFVVYPGTTFRVLKYTFEKYLDEKPADQVLCGHVLDRDNRYYELHPQLFYISANWWDSTGREPFDKGGHFTKEVNVPIRSEETHHGHYTPLWIKPGTEKKEFDEFCWGWNIINKALEDKLDVGIWDKEVRRYKKHCYPEDLDSYARELGSLTSDYRHYPFNTETFDSSIMVHYERDREGKSLENAVVCAPASGLLAMEYARRFNLKKGGKLIVFDASTHGLTMAEKVYGMWNGRNYMSFLESVMALEPEFIQQSTDFFDHKTGRFKIEPPGFEPQTETEEWQKWYDEYFTTFEIQFINLDVFNWWDMVRLMDDIDNGRKPGEGAYIYFTNIFHYHKTAAMFSPQVRLEYARQLQTMLRENNVDSMIYKAIGDLEKSVRRYDEQIAD